MNAPVDLATALSASSLVEPGGTILLRGGAYRGSFVSEIDGTPHEPVIIRSAPGEWAVLDGGTEHADTLRIEGSDTWVRDLEVMKSDPARRSRQIGNDPSDISRGPHVGVSVRSPRVKLINLIVHDNGDGIGFWNGAVDSEIYGCLIYNNGWIGSDRAWGHGIYARNTEGIKKITDSVVFNNFGYGVHAYDPSAAMVGVEVLGTTTFENGAPADARQANVLIGSTDEPADHIRLADSVAYHRPGEPGQNVRLGYLQSATSNGEVVVTKNDIVGGSRGLVLTDWLNASITDNAMYATSTDRSSLLIDLREPALAGDALFAPDYTWDENSYAEHTAGPSFSYQHPDEASPTRLTFQGWKQETGYDQDSTYRGGGGGDPVVTVRPNRYQEGRAFVTVFDPGGRDRITIDPAQVGARPDQSVEVFDVQHLSHGPIATVAGSEPMALPMDRAGIDQPIGRESVRHTSPQFGVFLIVAR